MSDYILWQDTVCRCAIELGIRRPIPMTVVTSQRSWRDSLEARVRVALHNLMPYEKQVVEGVTVERRVRNLNVVYNVAGVTVCLESAVARVCTLAEGGG